jgi:prolyl-tRNA editing enzyme YbaK/EbsC (Cys-tRNA(Pro) deacylase)
MSKSMKRVRAALAEAGVETDIVETGEATRTAQQAADVAGVALDQIVKSILFRAEASGQAVLFLTAGGNRVDPEAAAQVAGEPLGKADAAFVRSATGFVIGGVAPIGHTSPLPIFFDPRLLAFDVVWAAAGTPHHIFPIAPKRLLHITGAEVAAFCSTPNI